MSGVSVAGQRNAAQLVDALLQPSLLLVVELQHGVVPRGAEALWAGCVRQVEHLREQLRLRGLTTRQIDCISLAQCALIDETLLAQDVGEAHALWARESLQARFFNHHQAGERLYDELGQALREAPLDVWVLTAFQRVLVLGFKGRFQALDDPQRVQLLAQLNTQVATWQPAESLPTRVVARSGRWRLGRMPSVLRQAGVIVALLGLSWWGLDALLGASITQLPGLGQ